MTKDEALKLVLADIEANIAAVRTSTITAIKEALAQPPVAKPHEQEPVAWQKIECPICGDMAIATDILTPQRTWVGLSDEDRKLVRLSVGYNQFMTAGEYAKLVQKATELKLKEKNA